MSPRGPGSTLAGRSRYVKRAEQVRSSQVLV